MDNVLRILNETKEDLIKQLSQVETDIANWIEYRSIKDKNVLDSASNFNLKESVIESIGNYNGKTQAERIYEVIKKIGSEIYSDIIVKELAYFYEGKTEKWIQQRISAVLSENSGDNGMFYGYVGSSKTQHHKAKVWGINEFKDKNGNIKEVHKYKSTL